MMLLLLLGWWGCGQNPGALPPARGLCLQDNDCSQGRRCRNGSCIKGDVVKTVDASGEITPESTTPDAPPSDTEPSDNNQPEQPTEQSPENVTPELIPEGGSCVPGATQSCYRGAAGTLGIGKCKAGTQTCQNDGLWGPCEGDVLPRPELCNNEDDNCDGKVDESFTRLGQSCTTTGTGACKAQGTFICAADGVNITCDASVATPKQEECNGIDDDCDGKVDNIQGKSDAITRSCYNGPSGTLNVGTCKGGVETCSGGQWDGTCTNEIKPVAEVCDGKDNDCDGSVDDNCCATPPCCTNGDTQDCGDDTGECQKGTQKCTNNKWDACVGAIDAKTETCDGKDNDCDGSVDEDFKVGQSCTVGVGECQRQGQLKCKDPSTTMCDAQPGAPTAEKCDGKDNDCDGKTDENNPEGGGRCSTGLKGRCNEGLNTCKSGKLECVQTHAASAETCRNGQDEDCDGQIDEICGTQYPHAFVANTYFQNGQVAGAAFARRRFDGSTIANQFKSVQRSNTGQYLLTPSSSALGCSKLPLILTPYSHFKRAISYNCSGDNFRIHTTAQIKAVPNSLSTSLSHGDGLFFALIPNQGHDHWAIVDHLACIGLVAGGTPCKATAKNITEVIRTGTGVYRFKSDRCKDANNPIFATLQASQPAGWVGAKNLGNGTCEIRTFAANNTRSNFRSFVVWLPDPKKEAWAKITPNGTGTATINASNTFNEPGAQWTAGKVDYASSTCPPNDSASCPRTTVAFQAWRKPSIALVQGILSSNGTLQTHGAVLSDTNVTSGPLRDITISGFIGNSVTPQEAPFYILYIQ